MTMAAIPKDVILSAAKDLDFVSNRQGEILR